MSRNKKIKEYMDDVKTVQSTSKIVLEPRALSDEAQEFLLKLGCPTNIEIREPHNEIVELPKPEPFRQREVCEVCGSTYLIKEGRCTSCYECGWSKCSI